MAVTGEQVFTMAMVHMDEVEGAAITTDDVAEYRFKALSILTTLQTELLPKTLTPVPITDLSQNLLLSDRMCLLALPYGLAAHLLLTEDPPTASYFNSRYEELRGKEPATPTAITDVYDTLNSMR